MALIDRNETPEDRRHRQKCHCDDCRIIRSSLALLDTLASSDTWMPSVEIETLCKARELLAYLVGATYPLINHVNRYDNHAEVR